MSMAAPTVTGYSPFFSSSVGRTDAGNEASYNAVTRYARSSNETMIARSLSQGGYRGFRKIMRILNGAAAGSDATVTHARVDASTQGPSTAPGGARTIETFTDNSGNTTSAQKAYIDNLLDRVYNSSPSSYPTDASGNGGGGKGATTGVPAR